MQDAILLTNTSQMKHIIITGTSSGIGLQLVTNLLDAGHKVIALSRNNGKLMSLDNDRLYALNFDITDISQNTLLCTTIENFFQSKLDILINNAGQLINKPFKETTLEDFKSVYQTNLFGVVNILQTVLKFMPTDGHVVNISSMGGVQGSVKFPGLSAYSSSKGALITLTELLAEEYKEKGPSFNVLALGAVQTKMLEKAFPDFKAPVTAEEMAEYITNFALTGHQFYNGKLLQVSSTTP